MKTLKPFQIEDAKHIAARSSALVAHEPRVGKQQPVDVVVMTPAGERRIGDLAVGDLVIGRDGKPTRVTGVYPQGVQPSYQVTLRDGSSTECGLDHLWTVQDMNDRKIGIWRTKTLREIVTLGLAYKTGKFKRYVPTHSAVHFEEKPHYIAPYVLGALIGDGSLMEVPCLSVADRDTDIFGRVEEWLTSKGGTYSTRSTGANVKQYLLRTRGPDRENRIQYHIRRMGIDVHSHEKFIPDEYKFDSVENRTALLHGLMDTDGHAAIRVDGSSTSFASHSQRLAQDVTWLVRSLGGRATLSTYERGVKGTEYRVHIQTDFCPFLTEWKVARWRPVVRPDVKIVRYITRVEYVRDVEQVCISVDAPDNLYLTTDFIPTHNSGISIRASDIVRAEIVVIVCPAFVKANWVAAIEDFRKGGWTAVIVSYTKVAELLVKLRHKLPGVRINVLVVDESHYAKNRDAARTRSIYGTGCERIGGITEISDRVYCLTGTPMPNDPRELWPMLRAIAPELILNEKGRPMSFSAFRDKYCRVVRTGFGVKIVGGKNYKDLKTALAGFMIRRKRKDVFGRDLQPPTKLHVDLSKTALREIVTLENNADGRKLRAAIDSGDFTRLAKLEKSASSLRKMYGLAKVPGIAEIVKDELTIEPRRKQVIFCYHTDVIDAFAAALRQFGVLIFDGRVTPQRRAKLNADFLTKTDKRIALAQIDAMGVGVDLSSSDDALFAEQSWVGDNNEQARSRIFNMNDDNPKFTRFAVAPGTMDTEIGAAAERKLAGSRKLFG